MPYIEPDIREVIDRLLEPLFEEISRCNCSVGELNYILTKIVHTEIEFRGLSYSSINEVIGVLECMKLELYSQVARPYERKKKELNGAISDLDA